MIKNVISKILGSANDRLIKSYDKTVSLINDLEPKYHAMTDDELRGQTVALRERLAAGEREKDILPDAFALCFGTESLVSNIEIQKFAILRWVSAMSFVALPIAVFYKNRTIRKLNFCY